MKRLQEQQFLAYLLSNGYTKNSIKTILSCLSIYGKETPFTKDNFSQFIVRCRERGVETSSINKYVRCLKVCAKFIGVSWIGDIKPVKGEQTPVKVVLTDEETLKFLNVTPPRNGTNYEKQDIFWRLLAYTGARPSEIASLREGDVDLGNKVIYIRKSKTGEARIIPIHPSLIQVLSEVSYEDGYLCQFTKDAWQKQFNRRLKWAGIKKRKGLSAYSFRHKVITALLDEDKNMFLVKNLVGHKKTETTEKYYRFAVSKLHGLIEALPFALDDLPQDKLYDLSVNSIKTILGRASKSRVEQTETREYFQVRIYR